MSAAVEPSFQASFRTSQETFEQLLARQKDLEDGALAAGGKRFRDKLEKAKEKGRQATIGGSKSLLLLGLNKLEAGIRSFTVDRVGKGAPHVAARWIKKMGEEAGRIEVEQREARAKQPLTEKRKQAILDECMNEALAAVSFMVLKCVLDNIEQRRPLSRVAVEISDLLCDEMRYKRFQSLAPGLFEYKMRSFQTASYAHMARSLNATIKFADIDVADLVMPPNQRIVVGTKLIDTLIHCTGLVEVVVSEQSSSTQRNGKRRRERKDQLILTATEETLNWISKRDDILESLTPVNLPMIVPPIQWEQGQRGGYRYAMRNKYSLVRGQSAVHAEMIEEASMPLVYQALNAIQNTAWRINTNVLDVVQQLAHRGGGSVGIPLIHEEEFPAKPYDIATNADARKAWRKAVHEIRQKNLQRKVHVLEFTRVQLAAKKLQDEEAIFFPHSLDFRGRIYPMSSFLSPQGNDLCKSLLTFAQGKPLGSDGARWLAIHGANCMDTTPGGEKVSRMTLDERVQWVLQHSENIVDCAEDPLTWRMWMQAEEPLQFLAFCYEWKGYVEEGMEYVCSLPVAQDGSCNGLQHFSAMLRDPIGGEAVNLIPLDKPNDVYLKIAEKVLEKLTSIASDPTSGDALVAGLWLSSGLVNRKLTKRPTMTFSYGSKPYGFQDQLLNYLQSDLGKDTQDSQKEWEKIKLHFTDGEDAIVIDAAALMAQLIWHSLHEVVVAAFEAMAWFQAAARCVTKSGNPVQWSVPATGFPVRQEYFIKNKKQIETMLAGKVIQPVYYLDSPDLDANKQANAISPNIVHSLDAAALELTVCQAMDDGVEAFAVIHDSYGTVPGDMSVLAQATRHSFVKLYSSHDVIEELRQQFLAQSPSDGNHILPDPPTKGTLDIGQVLSSLYFFC